MMYKQTKNINGTIATCIIRLADGAAIPMSNDNTDYQAYLAWLEESPDNVPLPAENE